MNKALQFNECINTQDIKGLERLMTDDHVFIDSANNCVNGKSANKANWAKFFERFPDYRNIFEFVTLKDPTVIMQGYSLCSDAQLDHVKSIWTAQIKDGKVKEWRVYLDTEENRNNWA
jgi:ketosteroid isomerase-like protein